MERALKGNILTAEGWIRGSLAFADRIVRVEGATAELPDDAHQYIIPGFIDLHVHGGGGRDFMDGGDAARHIAGVHARHGTTSLLATTMTAPPEEIESALRDIGKCCAERAAGGARLLGVHLEGPYINPGKLGAQPDHARVATLAEIERFAALAPLKLITLAPEVGGHRDLIATLSMVGRRVQIGHTLGSYEDGVAALDCGAVGFTHLFNAMTGMHHREPGMVGAALAHAEFSELIPDLLHVHPGAIKAALRAIPQLYCVTDATSATDMPDGDYMLGRQQVHKCQGGVRLADGTLAGSTLTMDQALRNLVQLGLSVGEAARRTSTCAANLLGLLDRGRLQPGAWADMVILDRDLQLQRVFVEGEEIDLAHAH
jgi:N-acetylglucosamine-6-phosphate deacetylase